MKITSLQTRVNIPASKLFEQTGNFQNFVHYFNDQVKDIDIDENACSITIENMARITLKILERKPFTQIRFVAENDKNIPLFLSLNYTFVSENETDVVVEMDIEIPVFLRPLIQKPLERFVETLSNKIKTEVENN